MILGRGRGKLSPAEDLAPAAEVIDVRPIRRTALQTRLEVAAWDDNMATV